MLAATVAACRPASLITPTSRGTTLTTSAALPATARTTRPLTGRKADVEIALRAVEDEVAIFPDRATRVWRFVADVLSGPADAVHPLPDTYLGPVLRLKKGQRVRIRFTNEIPEESIVHWHGLHVPAEMDGHPRYVVNRGEVYEYEFDVLNRAGTYWYHPHPHGRTGPQVYMGLAGLMLVSDDEEEALGLPSGEFDIPLVLQDRTFDDRGQFVYLPNGQMDRMMGFLGDTIMVNGQPNFRLEVATRAYRLRVLNGSNSRIYKLAWSDGTPMTVIGNDGGLLERPVQKPYVVLAPGERAEIWADFSRYAVGTQLTLRSLPFTAGGGMMGGMGGGMGGGRMGGGMGGGMMGGRGGMMGGRGGRNGGMFAASIPQGEAFTVLRVEVTRRSGDRVALPQRLSTIERIPFGEAVNASRPRVVRLTMTPGRGWTLNGRTFEMTAVAPDEVVRLNTTEVWEFHNVGSGMGMGMLPHPMHMHGEQFQVVGREVDAADRRAWEDVREGHVDEGWKDTVLVMPGERVRVIRRFRDFTGLFLYHCHNLEHEDMGMMRNFQVVAS